MQWAVHTQQIVWIPEVLEIPVGQPGFMGALPVQDKAPLAVSKRFLSEGSRTVITRADDVPFRRQILIIPIKDRIEEWLGPQFE